MVKHGSEEFFFHPVSWFEPLQWNHVFNLDLIHHSDQKKNPKIHVDLGAGDGEFLCERARHYPEVKFLAVERLLGRARKIARRAYRENLPNVRVIRIEAAYAVEHLFSDSSIDTMTILFPDPWPKRRHHKNRLIQSSFLEKCARCIRPRGWLAMKTDDSGYFEQMTTTLSACKSFEHWLDVQPETLIPEITDFEQKFVKAGRSIYFVAVRRI